MSIYALRNDDEHSVGLLMTCDAHCHVCLTCDPLNNNNDAFTGDVQGFATADFECADVQGWTNALGQGCNIFAEQQWCTSDGNVGPNWRDEYVLHHCIIDSDVLSLPLALTVTQSVVVSMIRCIDMVWML